MERRLTMERLVRGKAPGREFDIEFWQALGPSRILEAGWELVVTAASQKGIHEDQLRLQRSVEKLERGRSALSRRRRLRVMIRRSTERNYRFGFHGAGGFASHEKTSSDRSSSRIARGAQTQQAAAQATLTAVISQAS